MARVLPSALAPVEAIHGPSQKSKDWKNKIKLVPPTVPKLSPEWVRVFLPVAWISGETEELTSGLASWTMLTNLIASQSCKAISQGLWS